MKKYLMTGIAALAMCAGLTSCSHDLEAPSKEELTQVGIQQIQNTYSRAFINTFGQPAASQDWGFGTTAAKLRTRAAMPATPTFRDTNPITKPTVSTDYKNTLAEAIAAGAKYAKEYQNYKNGDIIYINSEFSNLNNPQNNSDLTIYADGNVTYSGQTNQNGNGTVFCVTENSTLKLGAVSNNLTVYLAPNAVLDLTSNNITFQNSHAAIYMSAGSQVKAKDLSLVNNVKVLNDGGTITADNITLDQGCVLWNEGSITVEKNLNITNTGSSFYNAQGKTTTIKGKLDLNNNDALLYNEGTVNVTDAIVLHNSNAEIVNNGTLTGASFSSAAGGKMHNVGTTTITGLTDLSNSNSKWVNDGQYTSGTFTVDNYSASNFNNCKLTVNEQFYLNRGTFVVNSNASVVCGSFTWEDTSDFYLGGKSMLKVNGTLLTNNANSNYGFRGVGDDYAVIQAASITHNGNEQFRMSYYGKLYIATDSHFDLWYKDAPNTNQPSYYAEGSVKFKFKKDACPVTIPSSPCNPGYQETTPPPTEDPKDPEENPKDPDPDYGTTSIRIMAEDLSATESSDFDFNDVVIDVVRVSDTQAKIILCAAGGTLPLRIAGLDSWEVHSLFGVDTNVMVNTNWKGANSATKDAVEVGTVSGDFTTTNFNNAAKGIKLEVKKTVKLADGTTSEEWCEMTAEKGEPAAKFGCKTTYHWMDERTSIKQKVEKFTDWVKGLSELIWN